MKTDRRQKWTGTNAVQGIGRKERSENSKTNLVWK